MFVAEAKLFLAAHHAVVLDAAQAGFFEHDDDFALFMPVIQTRTFERQHDFLALVAHRQIGRAGDDPNLAFYAIIQID